jgi:hypothetical protein
MNIIHENNNKKDEKQYITDKTSLSFARKKIKLSAFANKIE